MNGQPEIGLRPSIFSDLSPKTARKATKQSRTCHKIPTETWRPSQFEAPESRPAAHLLEGHAEVGGAARLGDETDGDLRREGHGCRDAQGAHERQRHGAGLGSLS